MYQGRQAASAQAADDRHGSGQPGRIHAARNGAARRIGLAPVPESARAAREFTVATLRMWQLDALIEDAVVIASELATNAIRHGTPAATGDATGDSGSGRVELSWCLQASRLICVVTDQTGTPPSLADRRSRGRVRPWPADRRSARRRLGMDHPRHRGKGRLGGPGAARACQRRSAGGCGGGWGASRDRWIR